MRGKASHHLEGDALPVSEVSELASHRRGPWDLLLFQGHPTTPDQPDGDLREADPATAREGGLTGIPTEGATTRATTRQQGHLIAHHP